MSSGSTESDAPDDASKNGTPENALRSLRAALTDHVELTDNLLRLGTVPDSLFRAAHRSLARDIEHSGFLYALGVLDVEDPVGDARIDESPEGLQVLPTEATRRSMASAFSALRRARACAALSEGYAQRASTSTGAHVLLAGLRQDLREITQYLTTRAGQDLADGFEEIVISMNAHEREMQRAELARVATGLKSLRTRIQGIAYVLRLEALRLFERDMPARDRSGATEPDVSVRTAAVAAELRSIIDDARDDLRSAVRLSPFFGDGGDHRTRRSDRLRRNVWMLTQALRAFLAKAEAFSAEGLDRWDSPASLHFAAEFLVHFTALGTSVIHELRYERTPQLTAALSALTGPDGMGALAVPAAIAEGTALFELLELALVSISDRNELHDMPFDKRAAAETLKLHLEVPL